MWEDRLIGALLSIFVVLVLLDAALAIAIWLAGVVWLSWHWLHRVS